MSQVICVWSTVASPLDLTVPMYQTFKVTKASLRRCNTSFPAQWTEVIEY